MSIARQKPTIRCGFEFVCEATAHTPAILKIQPRLDPWQRKEKEQLTFPAIRLTSRNASMARRHFVFRTATRQGKTIAPVTETNHEFPLMLDLRA
jgi:hypothetical protein